MGLHLRRFGRSDDPDHPDRSDESGRAGDPGGGGAGPGQRGDTVLLAEASALLDGRAADRYETRGHAIPYWAWLNALAHRPPSAFRALATAYSLGPWLQATIDIADQLDRVSPAEALAIQAAVLVPAELDALATGRKGEGVPKPVRARRSAPRHEGDAPAGSESRCEADAEALVRVVRRHVAQTRNHRVGR